MKKRIIQALMLCTILTVSGTGETVALKKQANKPAGGKKQLPIKRGSGINAYVLGSSRRVFFDVYKVWPSNRAHIGEGEEKCEIFCPKNDLQLGDFTIPADHVYLVFYQDKLMRIRVINPYGGQRGMHFFNSIRAGLTQKYGDTKSSTPIFTRYDGTYTWKKDKQKIILTYVKLEYIQAPLEEELFKVVRKKKVVGTSDL